MKNFNIWEYHLAQEAMEEVAAATVNVVEKNNRNWYWVAIIGLLLIGLIGVMVYHSFKAFSAKQAKKQLEEQANQSILLHQFEQRLAQQEKKYPTQPQLTIPAIMTSGLNNVVL